MSDKQLPRSRYVASVPAPFFQVYDSNFVPQAMGENASVDIATTPEDLWQHGGMYTFPTAAGVVSIVSDDPNDTLLGTGAQKVLIMGLDEDWMPISEEVEMDGTTPVATTKEFWRRNAFFVTSAGSGEVNAGNITATLNAVTLAYIEIGLGSELAAIFSSREGFATEIKQIVASVTEATGFASAEIIVQFRQTSLGYSWWTPFMTSVANRVSGNTITFETPILVPEKSDIRLRVNAVSSNGMHIDGGFAAYSYIPI